MKIGAMNNPDNELYKEIDFIGRSKFDFLDLTLENPMAYSGDVDVKRILSLKNKYHLDIIGHTPWSWPIASSYKTLQDASFKEYSKCLDVFNRLNVNYVNIHPSIPDDASSTEEIIENNIVFFKRIVREGKKYKIRIMMENTKGMFSEIIVLERILSAVPDLYLHWDVGHANIGNSGERMTREAFSIFKPKIAHIHFSDNNSRDDLHLPLGAGNINWKFIMKILKSFKYNKTITLEIHSPDRKYLQFSRDLLRKITREVK